MKRKMPRYGGRPTATAEKVRGIAVAHVEAHQRMPTVRYCREKLGGGSMATIGRHLETVARELGYDRHRGSAVASVSEIAKALEPVLALHAGRVHADQQVFTLRVEQALERAGVHYQSVISNQNAILSAVGRMELAQQALRDRLDELARQDAGKTTELQQKLVDAGRDLDRMTALRDQDAALVSTVERFIGLVTGREEKKPKTRAGKGGAGTKTTRRAAAARSPREPRRSSKGRSPSRKIARKLVARTGRGRRRRKAKVRW
jgi:hypothetical protein